MGLLTKTFLHNTRYKEQNDYTTYKWEKIFVNYIPDKGLTPKIYKKLNYTTKIE